MAKTISGLLSVGDLIKFDFFGQEKQGRIQTVGKYGYWIASTTGCVGTGSIRCDFKKAILLSRQ